MKKLFTTIFFLGGLLLCQKASAQVQGATMGNPVNIGTLGGSYNTYTDTKNNSTSNGYGNEFNSSNYATGQPSDDIYYKFTLTANAQITLSTCGSGFDTYLHLLDASGTEIAYNDDDASVHCGGFYYESYLQTTLSAGTYYVVTEGWSNNAGNIILNLSVQGSNAFVSSTNFVRTFTPRTPIPDVATLQSLSADKSQVETFTQYLDGLGRQLQTVQKQGSPTGKDLVTPVEYDQYGREAKKYLSYASTATDGEYKTDALLPNAGVRAFYNPINSSGDQINYYNNERARIPTPYSETAFEPSPLNRPVEQGAPGDAWQLSTSGVLGSGHTVRTEYGSNLAADNVNLWTVNSSGNGAVTSGSYPENQLYKTTVTDENGNHTVEFKDKQGLVVCKKAESAPNTYIATYYIYDDLNNLAYVVPPIPGGSLPQSFTESADVFTGYIYGYHYDGRNRVVEKKVPGKGWEFMVYNPLDQVTFTQDAVQRNKAGQEWSFTLYDGLGRVAMTGVYKTGAAADGNLTSPDRSRRLALANLLAAQPTLWLTRDNTTSTGYNNTAAYASITTSGQILTINYYDDYNYPGIPYTADPNPNLTNRTTSLLTGTKTAILNPDGSYGPMLWNVKYYNGDGLDYENIVQNNIGGSDKYFSYYNFDHQFNSTYRSHSNSTVSIQQLISRFYIYDHRGRINESGAFINYNVFSGSYNRYNELGQLQSRSPVTADGSARQDAGAKFTYNARGWLTSITDSLLTEKLYYEVPSSSGITPNYNGNITEAWFNTPTAGDKRFSYRYDPLNRLKESSYFSGTNHTGELDESVSYDDLGNITSLNRGSYGAMPYVYSGSFGYNYTSNRLQTVSNNNSPYRSYGYDPNGNTTSNGELNFDYNLLNLPRYVKQGTNPVVSYTYSATGEKLRKQSGVNGTIDYVDGIQYRDGVMESIETEDGRYLMAGTGKFQYHLNDHLGNVRVMFEKATDKLPSAAVQENEYYAFGLNVARQDVSPANKYLYNGKELQNDYNLNQYDYGARFYDPIVARWGSVDPLSEKMRRYSPYNYGFNNPIRFVDPDGMAPEFIVGAHGGRASYTTDKNGKVTWHNATAATKIYGNALLAVGNKASLDRVINNDIKTHVIVSSATVDDGNSVTFGTTKQGNGNAADNYGKVVNADGTYGIKEATITINEGSIDEAIKPGSGLKLEGLTKEQAIGAVASHENVHGADKSEINKDLKYEINNNNQTRPDKEVKPNQVEQRIINQQKQKNQQQ